MMENIYYDPTMRSKLPPEVQTALKAKKMSLAELAAEAGCSVPTARRILRGEDTPKRSLLRKVAKERLADILGIRLP